MSLALALVSLGWLETLTTVVLDEQDHPTARWTEEVE